MEEAEREEEGEEEEEEESPKELESEEEEIAIAGAGGLGFSVLLALGRRWTFVVKKSRCRGRLNSEKVEDGSAVSHSSLVVAVWLMSINGKKMRRIGFGIIIAKTRGACVIAIN